MDVVDGELRTYYSGCLCAFGVCLYECISKGSFTFEDFFYSVAASFLFGGMYASLFLLVHRSLASVWYILFGE